MGDEAGRVRVLVARLADAPGKVLGGRLDETVVHRLVDIDVPVEELSVELAGPRCVLRGDVDPCERLIQLAPLAQGVQ
jgi:hypothetical protein